MNRILEQIKTRPLLFDGAFGTYYAARRCDRFGKYEEANLTAPGMVRQIAFEYITAGCDAIKTNTFGLPRMAAAQMPGWEELAEAGWKLACDAAAAHAAPAMPN